MELCCTPHLPAAMHQADHSQRALETTCNGRGKGKGRREMSDQRKLEPGVRRVASPLCSLISLLLSSIWAGPGLTLPICMHFEHVSRGGISRTRMCCDHSLVSPRSNQMRCWQVSMRVLRQTKIIALQAQGPSQNAILASAVPEDAIDHPSMMTLISHCRVCATLHLLPTADRHKTAMYMDNGHGRSSHAARLTLACSLWPCYRSSSTSENGLTAIAPALALAQNGQKEAETDHEGGSKRQRGVPCSWQRGKDASAACVEGSETVRMLIPESRPLARRLRADFAIFEGGSKKRSYMNE
ncbi:uncharacterized protein MYCFIDRAFT_179434 [Pseudocercospora fijiensis CIRAD86]|uniref:Uncharacterized protein n=1 Tax=Pseudocercospora fijiensis (strain CIRAD86) TaxID=383855 RepID=M3A0P5_PSEFD|nr:uncharacterized protein MYCFIDRAFT_179434 [Pseudocercospora fijiensis CIRAD86]EME77981.1 hypothetical protein MYCFIDRAFT_179434 [Pseudocercospora fijiensis CIRAD86]